MLPDGAAGARGAPTKTALLKCGCRAGGMTDIVLAFKNLMPFAGMGGEKPKRYRPAGAAGCGTPSRLTTSRRKSDFYSEANGRLSNDLPGNARADGRRVAARCLASAA